MEVHKEGVPFVFAISADRAGPLVGRGTTTATPRRLMFPATARKTLNLHIARRQFHMLTIKQLLGLVQPGDWFTTIDLKDGNFYVEIAPKPRNDLRFAFQGVAYEYNRLPFGYSELTFSKCVATALQPLCARGMRVFFYLDDLIRRVHTGVLFPVLFPFSSVSTPYVAFTPKRVLSAGNFYPHF